MLDLIAKLLRTVGKLFFLYFFLSALVIQVYLGHDGQVQVYANATIQPSSPVNADLLLDQSEANIYVMTRNTVCAQKTNTLLLNVPKCDAANHVVCTNCDNCFARHQKQHFHSKPWPRCLLIGRLSFSGWTIYRLSGVF